MEGTNFERKQSPCFSIDSVQNKEDNSKDKNLQDDEKATINIHDNLDEKIISILENKSKTQRLSPNLFLEEYSLIEKRDCLLEGQNDVITPLSELALSDCVFGLWEKALIQTIIEFTKFSAQFSLAVSKHSIMHEIQSFVEGFKLSFTLPNRLELYLKRNIISDAQLLVFALTQIPIDIIQFLENSLLNYLENIEILADEIDLIFCMEPIANLIKSTLNSYLDLTSLPFVLEAILKRLVPPLIKQLSFLFQESKSIILTLLAEFKTATEKPVLGNRYVIIGLLKQLADESKLKIVSSLKLTLFQHLDPTMADNFAAFVLQTHELFDLKVHVDIFQEIELKSIQNEKLQDKKTLAQEIEAKLKLVMKSTEKFTLCKVQRGDGHNGYLLELQNGKQYLLHRNNQGIMIILNQKFMSKGWVYTNEAEPGETKTIKSFDQLLLAIKDRKDIDLISQNGKNLPPPDLNKSSTIAINSAAGDLGSSLGYCLANINKYNSTTDFLKDFGYVATLNGSITYIVYKLPIVGTLLMVGGLGFSTLKLASNKVGNSKSKLQQIGKIALGAGSTFTGSMSGALIGQAAIPIPILGAFIGGVIGGVLGSTSSNYMLKMLNKSKFEMMIIKIEKTITPEGNWLYSRDMLNILGITNKFFQKYIPQTLQKEVDPIDCQDVWMTLICYAILTAYTASHEQKEREKLQKQLESCEDPKQSEEILSQIEYSKEWNPKIDAAQQWISNNHIQLIKHLKELEQCMSKIINEA